MNKELHRHDISDSDLEKVKPHTIGEKREHVEECKRYSTNHKRRILDFLPRNALER